MLVITEAQVAELLTPLEAIGAVEGALDRLVRGVVDNPPRVHGDVPGGVFAVMPCVDHELGYAGLKSFLWLPGGAPFVVVLFSIEDARLEAVVEAARLGELRTAAASAVAARRFAPRARTLGIFGCGRQAASHAAALRAVLPLERVLVRCRDEGRLAAFCAEHDCEPGSPEAVGGCDVVVTATTAKAPVLRGAWLQEDALVCAVGANDLHSRELDDDVLARASLVCTDSVEQAKLEAGDLAAIDWSRVRELQNERESPGGITVFKSNGLAAWDIAAAARVVELSART